MNWVDYKKRRSVQSEVEKRQKELFARRRRQKEESMRANMEGKSIQESPKSRAARVALTLFSSSSDEEEEEENVVEEQHGSQNFVER